jgi:asparaginyl-tRNA synthetase
MAIHRFFDEHGFVWVNTPIITASDAEGAGELFRVSTLDLANLPRTPRAGRLRAGLLRARAVPHRVGPAQRRDVLPGAVEGLHVRPDLPRGELQHQPHLAEFWMIEPRSPSPISRRRHARRARCSSTLPRVLAERPDDMAFFEERDREGRDRQAQGIVDTQFVRMDYTEAIAILEQAKQKFEFPVKWGIDLQSRARALPRREARGKPVILMNYPKEIKAFYMRVERRRQDGRGDGRARARHRRDHRRQPARGAPRRARRRMAEAGIDPRALRLVPRLAPLRHRAARRLRPRLRAHRRLL